MPEDGDSTADQLAAYSELVSLGHSRERLQELAPKVNEIFALIRRVREADVDGHEMAVNYWARGSDAEVGSPTS